MRRDHAAKIGGIFMRSALRWAGVALGALAVVAIILYAAVYVASERVLNRAYPFKPVAIAIPTDAESIVEGRRLAQIHMCFGGCHGKGIEGEVLFDDPMIARVVAPDLTASMLRYRDDEIAGIVKSGVRPDGRSMVVMPSDVLKLLADEDLGLIIAFLRSVPAAAGPGPDFWVGPIGRIGIAGGQLKTMAQLLAEATAPPDAADRSATHGRYLASTICAHCHATNLAGAPAGPGTDASPPLQIVAAYSPEAFTQLLRTGVALGDRKLGMMRDVALASLSKLTDEEIADLYQYLRALPVSTTGAH
jgi:cytochrome c553